MRYFTVSQSPVKNYKPYMYLQGIVFDALCHTGVWYGFIDVVFGFGLVFLRYGLFGLLLLLLGCCCFFCVVFFWGGGGSYFFVVCI